MAELSQLEPLSLDERVRWMARDNVKRDHRPENFTFGNMDSAPCAINEKRPIANPETGEKIDGIFATYIILNNPAQFNSYTTEMVKAVAAGFKRASEDPKIRTVVFTAVGDKAFCTGGNTEEYATYYTGRPDEYRKYMELFVAMVDSILGCKKPVINRVNGMRIAGGQEIGMMCDQSIAADTAVFGQAGPRHGSAPLGGSTDVLMGYLGSELGIWSCVSCETMSAYKAWQRGLIVDVVPVLKTAEGKFVPNPLVVTDGTYEMGKPLYGEFKRFDTRDAKKAAMAGLEPDHTLLDRRVDEMVWNFVNQFPGCTMKTLNEMRRQKRAYWDQNKDEHIDWLATNMGLYGEAHMGFAAFNNKAPTGTDRIDFLALHQAIARGEVYGPDTFYLVMPQPKPKGGQ